MSEKYAYDVRGRQSMILRLYNFDKEGLLHMLFYRIAIIFSFIAAAAMLWSIVVSGNPFNKLSEILVIVIGILFIPQLFESMKAIFLILSRGIVFGMLNPSFLRYGAKKHAIYQLYKLIPYITIAVWMVCLVLLWEVWSL